ncbi:E3 ubiquitin-protein ligase MARCHF8-like [Ruditapes philippinarum]|uniref:E3 ubiquitin-protein ligase MARCHF8-like n=1 Tax=Ruditapes philippinarum TaxID=129788 RepID=UPI00295AB6C4|nr:E3 ubiquitin-protein ligase MARCHF8-like [Ruditapes philippinarum]
MSPALFVSQSTSTPGPNSQVMDSPTCQSILENNKSIFNFSECNMCRICHEDGSMEKLVSPCHCAGTMGMLHVSCLERWLGSSNTTKCEICQFQFIVQKKPRPLKWYMQEPTLKEDRLLIVKDIVILVTLAGLVLAVAVLCLVFAKRLTDEHKPGPAAVLIILTVCSVMLYAIWMFVAVRRMRRRVHLWHVEHHIIQIKQKNSCPGDTSNKIFRRFPVKLPSARQKTPISKKKKCNNNNLVSTSFIGCSLESYKAAMFNPVTPTEPLLQDDNNNDITTLNETSPSVVSLDEIIDECLSYYQPPECGTTSVLLNNDSSQIVRETGV